ncbi:MAG: hypothetical protein IPH60_08645 [Flavobacteriales bacterium]|nr:hypothetical protein [Flavobacteriales bacterium]
MIKWNTYGDPVVQTSNMFVMPYVHNDPTIGNNGIHIQIGPGNSENNFNMGSGIDLMDLTPVGMNGSPSAYMSYPHSLWKLRRALNSTLRPTGQFEDGLLSHDPVPSNFGIGLPWAGLLPIHHRFEAVLGYEPEGTLRNPALDAGMAFWWSNGTVNMPWINKPTVLTPNTGIKKVELIRYGKQPWMLKHVIKSVRNGNLTNDEGWESETDLELVHTRVDQQVPVLIRGANPNSPHFEPYYRSIYELDRIIHRPIANNIIADPIQLDQQPTTRFVYSDAKGMAPLLEDFYCANLEMDYPRAIPKRQIISLSRLLTTVHDQLGTITKVIYNDPLSSNLAHFDILDGQNPGVVFGIPECNPNASLIPATGTIIPTVKEIHRSDERGEGIRVTTYTYGDRSSKYRGYPFLNQRYRFGRSAGTSFGYTTVTVSEATGANGGRVSREYDFHADVEQVTYTSSPVSFDDEPYSAEFQSPIWPPSETDVNDILLWGRIKEIRVKNPQGTILERTSIDHEATLAFENGSLRPSQGKRLHSLNKFDYMDYMPGFDLSAGTTSGRTELENRVGGLQGPRFLEADVIPEGSAFHIPMPESYLNSYFIKKVRETHTVYDPAACSMGTTVPGTTDPIEGVVMFNPDGTNTANNHTNSNAEALITALEQEGLTEATKALLLSSSPLQESVIQKALSVVDETTAKRLKEILDAQAKLTDERLTQAVDNADKLEPDDAAKILAAQPVLSDPVLSEILVVRRSLVPRRSRSYYQETTWRLRFCSSCWVPPHPSHRRKPWRSCTHNRL